MPSVTLPEKTVESRILLRNPALSWRCLPFGYIVRDHFTATDIALDALGSALFHRLRRPTSQADIAREFADEPAATRTLEGLIADHVLTTSNESPIHLTSGDKAASGKSLIDDLMIRGYRRASIPYAAGLEWTPESDRYETAAARFGRRSDGTLDTRLWVRVLEQMASLGALKLFVTGTDPLFRSDALFLLKAARDAGFSVTLFTEGDSITPTVAERAGGPLPGWDLDSPLCLRRAWPRLCHAPGGQLQARHRGYPGAGRTGPAGDHQRVPTHRGPARSGVPRGDSGLPGVPDRARPAPAPQGPAESHRGR